MNTGDSRFLVQLAQEEPKSRWQAASPAILEVVVATVSGPVLWQGFKRFIPLGHLEVSSGLNFSAGIVTILIAVCLFLWRRKSFAEYGVSLRRWPEHLKIGVVLAVILIVVLFPIRLALVHYQGEWNSPYGSWQSPYIIDLALSVISLALFPWLFRLSQRLSIILPTALAMLILFGLWITPLGLAYDLHYPVAHIFLVVVGLIVTTGFAEEFLYRGYIQPRLNEILGRPYFFGGIQFGWGLILASVLFGFVHTLNGVDFLHGHFDLNWGWGLVAFVLGLAKGLLREATGSIIAGTVLHGITDIWAIVVTQLFLG